MLFCLMVQVVKPHGRWLPYSPAWVQDDTLPVILDSGDVQLFHAAAAALP
jgi:hypothetical protein